MTGNKINDKSVLVHCSFGGRLDPTSVCTIGEDALFWSCQGWIEVSLPDTSWTFTLRLNWQMADRPTLEDKPRTRPRKNSVCLYQYVALDLASHEGCVVALPELAENR